jgi:hypothetical protein
VLRSLLYERPSDEEVATRAEALAAHLKRNGVIARAEADLERRRKDAPTPEPQLAPIDPATRRFLSAYEREW